MAATDVREVTFRYPLAKGGEQVMVGDYHPYRDDPSLPCGPVRCV